MNEQQPDKVQLPTNFDPNDPDLGSPYRRDVVRDVTDFRTAERPGQVNKDRIKSLEDRVKDLEEYAIQLYYRQTGTWCDKPPIFHRSSLESHWR